MRNISYLLDLRTDEASDRSKRSDALNRGMISRFCVTPLSNLIEVKREFGALDRVV